MKLQQAAWRLFERLGRTGVAGLLLLLAALGWQLGVNTPLQARAQALQAGPLAQPQSNAPGGGATQAAVLAPAALPDGPAALAAFEARLPRLQELPQLLARIDQGAAAQRVELQAGDYRLERQAGERWLRYRITLPVRARYAQVRGLVDHVLVALPTAALDDIELQRDGTDAQTLQQTPQQSPLQARLRFTLFLRP